MLPLNFTRHVSDKKSLNGRILYRGCIYRCRELESCSRRPSSGIGRRTTTTASGTSRRRRNDATSIGRRECSPASSSCIGCKYLVSAFIITPTVLIKLHCCTAALLCPILFPTISLIEWANPQLGFNDLWWDWENKAEIGQCISNLGAELKCRFCSTRHVIECKCPWLLLGLYQLVSVSAGPDIFG